MTQVNLRQRFELATQKWEGLQAMGAYSAPPEEGTTAILVSQNAGTALPEGWDTHDQLDFFKSEAEIVADGIRNTGGSARVYNELNPRVMAGVLANEDVSSIVVIGHGNLTSALGDEFNPQSDSYNVTWRDVSRLSSHLKLGSFVSRTCGRAASRFSVPLGLFAMSDHRDVYAPVGKYFVPELGRPDEEAKIVPVSAVPQLRAANIQELFPYQKSLSGES